MSLNCNEINLILDELDLENAFIQDIIQPGYDTLALYTYKESSAKTLLICTAQNSVRLNQTNRKITKNDKPLRFMEFLRSHIKGCRINSITQIGLERVVKLELSRIAPAENKKNESVVSIQLPGITSMMNQAGALPQKKEKKEEEKTEFYNLYIKLWNNAANVILCDQNDVILEPMFRRPERNEIKDKVYAVPVPDKEKTLLSKDAFPIRKWNNGALRGVPAAGVAEDVENGLCEGKAFPSFNAFIDEWYSEHAQNLSRESLLEKAEKWYNINHSKKEAALQNLLKKQESFENAEQYKHQGDLILSFGHMICADSKFLECEDYESGKTVRIEIDPKKSAQENASDYYKKYKKAQSGAEEIVHDIQAAKNQLEKLEAQYKEIISEKNPVKIEQLLRKDSTPKQQIKKSHPGLEYIVNGWTIYVGRDANENDDLLRHHVRGDDLWLHVRDYHGGYVFIKAQKNKTVPLDILLDAGNLAVYYSKARTNTKVDLYYTHVKYLRRAKNGPKGLVIPTQEKNLCISPDKDRLRKLDSLHQD